VVRLRVALYRDFDRLVDEAVEDLELPPRAQVSRNVEGLLGRFVDAAWAYRFGLTVASDRLAYAVRVTVPGWLASDDAFSVEPGHERVVALTPAENVEPEPSGVVTALNLAGHVRITEEV
jgi:hypothetical protein